MFKILNFKNTTINFLQLFTTDSLSTNIKLLNFANLCALHSFKSNTECRKFPHHLSNYQ